MPPIRTSRGPAPGSDFRGAMFGHGGSLWAACATGWATNDAGQAYYTIDLPLDIAHALRGRGRVARACVSDEKGQRQFQSTYRRVPNANHYFNSRESGKPCFLVIEGAKAPRAATGGDREARGEGRRGGRRGGAVVDLPGGRHRRQACWDTACTSRRRELTRPQPEGCQPAAAPPDLAPCAPRANGRSSPYTAWSPA